METKTMKALLRARRVVPLMLIVLLVCLLWLVGERLMVAHAASTIIVTSCPNETTLNNDIANAGNGGTVRFSINSLCTIPITSTLFISQDVTLDNQGQRVTLDGGGTTQVLSVGVNIPVTFTL